MGKVIVHLSDIHYRSNWEENHGVVFRAFFKDLKKQIEAINGDELIFVISGDAVQAGRDSNAYNEFHTKFKLKLDSLGIPRANRICVPGNHDIATDVVASKKVLHEALVSQSLDETEFNDYSENPEDVFKSKFKNYSSFESKFSECSTIGDSLTGAGRTVADDIGVYCLNTAFFSSGGMKNADGSRVTDKRRLAVDTRRLHRWNDSCDLECKILIMHHPLDWLTDWAKDELGAIMNSDFSLCLSGHSHDQTIYHSVISDQSLIHVSAPPLFTNKRDELGYSLIFLSEENRVSHIQYRQWTKHQSFVSGVNFSNSDDGKVLIGLSDPKAGAALSSSSILPDVIGQQLEQELQDSLTTYSSQPKVWIEPVLSKESELDRDADPLKDRISVSDLVRSPKSTVIKAPPQFGLTCLAHHLACEAWRASPNSLWICLDSRMMKPSQGSIRNRANVRLHRLGCSWEDIGCVVLDSWNSEEKGAYKLLDNVCKVFDGIPVIVMQTIDYGRALSSADDATICRKFDVLHLWSLSREHIRSVVSSYNNHRHIGDEDSVTSKVITDLEMLNIHRTPLNCITMLKVSEIDFDESPVNRTEMLKRVLFLLFNIDDLPTYKNRPDMQDCEYVLGYFCETMIRQNDYIFSQKHFLSTLESFCCERVMDLDVEVVFDILFANHIIVRFGNSFRFKFTYWLYYFAAQRMHHDQAFADFIYKDMQYTRFPEVIEFYTGIDRRREDALGVLCRDLNRSTSSVQKKLGLPEFNPYRFIQWNPSSKMLEQMQEEVRGGVTSSNLPAAIKDRYSDQQYDRTRPYHQDVRDILSGDSLVSMIMAMRAASRALRNSDYVDPAVKRQVLEEILSGWKQLSKVLLIMVPLLAERGHASFDGMSFLLTGDFGNNPEERFRSVLMHIPFNVVSWYKDDLFSQKMGPLLLEKLSSEDDAIRKHELVLLLITQRPSGWKEAVQKYIGSISKDSFYLYDTTGMLRLQYAYSYAVPRELQDMEYLIKMSAVKHAIGTKSPGKKAISKVSDSVLPKRKSPGADSGNE